MVREAAEALGSFLREAEPRAKEALAEFYRVHRVCQDLVALYEQSMPAGMINEDFFNDLQEEMACELRLMEAEEAEAQRVAERIEELYRRLHPEDYLRTIPGVGEQTAPVFLAAVGDPQRFRSQASFANWTGVVPGAKQSSEVEGKRMRMTKAGPALMRQGLYQAGDIGRQYDPQLACLYYREMVYHGKTHRQAMGAVMSHLGARILVVLREKRPYELRDPEGKPIGKEEARKLILSQYKVPEQIRRQRRRRNPRKAKGTKGKARYASPRASEVATAPQPGSPPTLPGASVYLVSAEKSR